MAATTAFEPARFLTRVNGSDYLEVKWRLVWLRDQHPEATVETQLVSHERDVAVFRAEVTIPGGGSSTGWGMESAGDFRDYLEKAETKALGRALAALGFGTQFCPDFEFGAAAGRVVDSPVKTSRTSRPGQPLERSEAPAVAAIGPDQPATPRQIYAPPLQQRIGRRFPVVMLEHAAHRRADRRMLQTRTEQIADEADVGRRVQFDQNDEIRRGLRKHGLRGLPDARPRIDSALRRDLDPVELESVTGRADIFGSPLPGAAMPALLYPQFVAQQALPERRGRSLPVWNRNGQARREIGGHRVASDPSSSELVGVTIGPDTISATSTCGT